MQNDPSSSPSTEAKLRKLDKELKRFALANCLLGLIVSAFVILIYFATRREILNEGGLTIEIYHYTMLSIKLVMLGFVPILGVLAILTGVNSLLYLRNRKKLEEKN
jgi:preprotein translocase subunit SecY